MPAQHALTDHILVDAQVHSVAISQRRLGDDRDKDPIGSGGRGMFKQSVGGAAQAVAEVGCACEVSLEQQRMQALAVNALAQMLVIHPTNFWRWYICSRPVP